MTGASTWHCTAPAGGGGGAGFNPFRDEYERLRAQNRTMRARNLELLRQLQQQQGHGAPLQDSASPQRPIHSVRKEAQVRGRACVRLCGRACACACAHTQELFHLRMANADLERQLDVYKARERAPVCVDTYTHTYTHIHTHTHTCAHAQSREQQLVSRMDAVRVRLVSARLRGSCDAHPHAHTCTHTLARARTGAAGTARARAERERAPAAGRHAPAR